MAQTTTIKQRIAKLQGEINRLQKKQVEQNRKDQLKTVKRAGIVVGGYYQAIPLEHAGDVLVGKVLKVGMSRWNQQC
jgi:hypothetical protein